MLISGTGFRSNFNVKIKPDFKPDTQWGFSFNPLSSGYYSCTDRGATCDKYECEVSFYNGEATELVNAPSINEIINAFESNRTAGSNIVTLSNFSKTEYIFGADVNYSGSITATAIMPRRTQNTLKGWGLSVRLIALSPAFVGTPALPTFGNIEVGVDADSDRTINKYRSYNNTYFYADEDKDKGSFTGTAILTQLQMQGFRRYIATQRGATVSIPNLGGIAYPWGRRTTSYPLSAKIIDFKDLGMFGVSKWRAQFTLAENI
jgi:hypothetical protein